MASSDRGCTPTYDLRELGAGLGLYARLDRLADRFLELAGDEVGAAFTRVPEFAARAATETGREAEWYRRTPRERYLVELLAIVLMGRQLWPAFAARRDVVVILPDCLRIDGDACRREADGDRGPRCTGCNPDCVAGRISDVAEEHGAAAYFAERERAAQFGAWKRAHPDLALLGVACIWMLAKGMRDAEEAGIPSQGVLLNYSACDHWSAAPATTDAVVERVAEILRLRAARRAAGQPA
jgi:hypothetical protein